MAVGVLMSAIWLANGLTGLECTTWSWRVNAFARPGADTPRIRLILLDQSSLDWASDEMALSWPWPRQVYAPIIQFCQRAGARTVAFDVLYTEPSAMGVDDDQVFGEAIRAFPGFVGALYLSHNEGKDSEWPAPVAPPPVKLAGMQEWLADEKHSELVMQKATFPIVEVATNSHWLAEVKGWPDPDGIIRRTTPFRFFSGQAVPSLGLAAMLAGAPKEMETACSVEGRWLHLGERRYPMDRKGRLILRYHGDQEIYQPVSAAAVIQSEVRLLEGGEPVVDPETFRDCYVFFGFSAPGLLDLRPTPVSNVAPGVFVHATLLDNLLSGRVMRDAPVGGVVAGTWLLTLLAGWGVLCSRHARQSVLLIGGVLIVAVGWSFVMYALGWWWPMVYPTLTVALVMVGGVVVNYATEGRQKQFIKSAFKHYLSPDVIDRILEDPGHLQLGGERRELTIFFSDLQGFSSISEKLDPQQLTALLNEYLTDMTDIILDEGGTLDKYEGDAIIAFWNAPLDQADHAERACRAALRCQQKLADRRAEFEERTGAKLLMRVGINTGEVVVGNMGSTRRFDYTVLGDAANLASRLEGANKNFGTYTMVSESTWEKGGCGFAYRELGRLRVVGRKTPVKVFELTGLDPALRGEEAEAFEQALVLCAQNRLDEAQKSFAQWSADPAAQSYVRFLKQHDGAWDGVWNLTSK
jgi:adenylate cyclase